MIEQEVAAAVHDRTDADAVDSYWRDIVAEAERDRRMRRRAWSVLALAFAAGLVLACRLVMTEADAARLPRAAAKPYAVPPSEAVPSAAQRVSATPAAAASSPSDDAQAQTPSVDAEPWPETRHEPSGTNAAIARPQAARARPKAALKRPPHAKEDLPPAQTASTSRPDYSWVDRYAP